MLIIVQRDTTQSSLFIILQVHSTYCGCQPHPSSGVYKTVTTASGTGHIFVQLLPSNVTKLAWPRWREAVFTVLCTPDDVDGWTILGRISGRWDVGMWTGLGWPRIETGDGRL